MGLSFGSRVATWDCDFTHLPLKPLFPGFYIDTALYASFWWAALFFRPFRRSRRIARGLCPACAYSLKGLPPDPTKCPECGGPTRQTPKCKRRVAPDDIDEPEETRVHDTPSRRPA